MLQLLECVGRFGGKLRLKKIKELIRSGKLFGPLVYMVGVVEFQKRGLPHAHLCIKKSSSEPKKNREVDQVIKA